jgi:hypothetical protein
MVTEYISAKSQEIETSCRRFLRRGETGKIATAVPDPLIADISPDNSELLVTTFRLGPPSDFWVVPVPAGSPRRLNFAKGNNGAWTPTGKFVFAIGQDLYEAAADGSAGRKLLGASGAISFIRFSNDDIRTRFATSIEHGTDLLRRIGLPQ